MVDLRTQRGKAARTAALPCYLVGRSAGPLTGPTTQPCRQWLCRPQWQVPLLVSRELLSQELTESWQLVPPPMPMPTPRPTPTPIPIVPNRSGATRSSSRSSVGFSVFIVLSLLGVCVCCSSHTLVWWNVLSQQRTSLVRRGLEIDQIDRAGSLLPVHQDRGRASCGGRPRRGLSHARRRLRHLLVLSDVLEQFHNILPNSRSTPAATAGTLPPHQLPDRWG